MTVVSQKVATRFYILAFLSGLIALAVTFWAMPTIASMWTGGSPAKISEEDESPFIVILEVIVGGIIYGSLGALFGYLWPAGRWRWGLWLSLPLLVYTAFYPVYILLVLLLHPSEILRFLAATAPFATPVIFASICAAVASRLSYKRSV